MFIIKRIWILLILFVLLSIAISVFVLAIQVLGTGQKIVPLDEWVLTQLALGIAIAASLAIALTYISHKLWFIPLEKLEADMTAVTHDPELILPPAPNNGFSLSPIDHTRMTFTSLSHSVRQSLRQRQRLADIGEAVTKINHDLRNLLASVTLVMDQLEESKDPQVKQIAPIIIRATEQASDLCQNLLNYMAELPPPRPSPIDMTELIDELRRQTDASIQYDGPTQIFTDRLMMSRILLNLARNATHEGADALHIDIWKTGHLAVMDISDNGPGIAPHLKDQLFSAFTSGRPAGSGLGLAICLDLALALGGNLRLSRSSPIGCEFRLQLPAAIIEQLKCNKDFGKNFS